MGDVAKLRGILVALVVLIATNVVSAQDKFSVADESKIVVQGTSTIHDWETKVTEFSGGGVFAINSQTIELVNNFQLSIPVKSLESGKKGMDNKIYEALKADKAPHIQFQFRDAQFTSPGKVTVKGKMTIAGKSKDVQLVSDYRVDNGNIIVKGTHSMKMTEFDIAPPTAMMGTVKAGDQIQIVYDLLFINETNSLKTSN
jgi:polyisoprenoid-binding protein YceI